MLICMSRLEIRGRKQRDTQFGGLCVNINDSLPRVGLPRWTSGEDPPASAGEVRDQDSVSGLEEKLAARSSVLACGESVDRAAWWGSAGSPRVGPTAATNMHLPPNDRHLQRYK